MHKESIDSLLDTGPGADPSDRFFLDSLLYIVYSIGGRVSAAILAPDGRSPLRKTKGERV